MKAKNRNKTLAAKIKIPLFINNVLLMKEN